MTNEALSKKILSICAASQDCWAMAEETADSAEQSEEFARLGSECDDEYDLAAEAVRAGALAAAREHLDAARSLEREGGDCSHADRALEILDAARE